MKKNLNKLATLALTGAMVAGMSFGSLAATTSTYITTGAAIENNTISFRKDLGVWNYSETSAAVAVPHVKYTYKLEGGVAGSTQDTKGNALDVKAGLGSITTGIETEFGGDTDQSDAADDHIVSHNVELNLSSLVTGDDHPITEPGIYHYVLTETAVLDKNDQNYNYTGDVTETKDDAAKRSLLVYVGYGDTDGATLEVLSTVMFTYSVTDSRFVFDEDGKKEGYLVETTTEDGKTKLDPEKIGETESVYKTYNLTLKKQTYGNMVPSTAKFLFTADLAAAPDGVKFATDLQGDVGETDAVAKNAVTSTYSLGKGETLTIKSVPVDVTYKFSEALAADQTGYTTYYGVNVFEITDPSDAEGKHYDNKATAMENFVQMSATETNSVYFLNIKDNMTPTGVVMNVAPYAAMILGAGAFAGIFLGMKKKEDEE